MTEPGATLPPPDADEAAESTAAPAPGDSTAPAVARSIGTTPTDSSTVILTRPPRAGELTSGWRVITACCWIGVVASFAAIWNTSERLGLSTWWLGPRGDPMPVYVRLLPFVAPTLMILAVSSGVRWLWRWGVGAALVTAAIGLGDLGGFSGLAGIELAAAVAALAVSLASSTGMYRPAPGADDAALR